MTDPQRPSPLPDASPVSAPALISFCILTLFAITVLGLFILILTRTPVDSTVIAVLGGVFTTEANALAAITGFWLANSLNANRANANKDAVIAQQAGSGPPPPEPAQPVATETAQ